MITIQNIEKVDGVELMLPYCPDMTIKTAPAIVTVHYMTDEDETLKLKRYHIVMNIKYTGNRRDMLIRTRLNRKTLCVEMGPVGRGWLLDFTLDTTQLASPHKLIRYLFTKWEEYRSIAMPFPRTT